MLDAPQIEAGQRRNDPLVEIVDIGPVLRLLRQILLSVQIETERAQRPMHPRYRLRVPLNEEIGLRDDEGAAAQSQQIAHQCGARAHQAVNGDAHSGGSGIRDGKLLPFLIGAWPMPCRSRGSSHDFGGPGVSARIRAPHARSGPCSAPDLPPGSP